jgi:hypothetical protein
MRRIQHVGGSFAPPLTDELLANYAELADTAEPEIRDAMLTLHKCAAAWWEQPESTSPGRPHMSGRGTIIALDKPIAAALWDLIPWTRELVSMGELFASVQADEVARNSVKLAAWRSAVTEAIARAMLPGGSIVALQAKVNFYHEIKRLCGTVAGTWGSGIAEYVLDKLFAGSNVEAAQQAANEYTLALKLAFSGASAPPVPRPELEPTPLRDAAHHLLWFARELDMDREPITKDKL